MNYEKCGAKERRGGEEKKLLTVLSSSDGKLTNKE